MITTAEQQRNIHQIHVDCMERGRKAEREYLKAELRRLSVNRTRRNSGKRIVA